MREARMDTKLPAMPALVSQMRVMDSNELVSRSYTLKKWIHKNGSFLVWHSEKP